MKEFAAVFGREVRERRLVVAAALAIGLTPFLVPFFPGVNRTADVRGGVALVLAGLISALLALFLGASVFARDLGERRSSFYFSRPLPGWSLWSGKLAAALLLTVGCGLLVLLPVGLFGDLRQESLGLFLGLGLLLSILLLLAANASAVILRARSPWLILDFLAALAVAGLGWISWSQLRFSSPQLATVVLWGIGLALLLALLAASAVQVIGGRTDLLRGHRLLSLSLWATALLLVLGLAGYGRWVLSAGPRDLKAIDRVIGSPSGDWIGLAGATGRGTFPTFLIQVSTGRAVRTASAHPSWRSPLFFAADGRSAFWTQQDSPRSSTLFRLDLTRPEAQPAALPVQVLPWDFTLAVSPDGRRLAHLQGNRLTVEDLETHRLLASFSLPGRVREGRLRFLDADRLRFSSLILPTTPPFLSQRIEISDLTLPPAGEPRLVPLRQLEIPNTRMLVWQLGPDGERLLTQTPGPGPSRLSLWDVARGTELLQLTVPAWRSGSFLADGRVAVVSDPPEGARLALYGADGSPLGGTAFPEAHRPQLGGLAAPDLLAVAVERDSQPSAYYLDLRTFALRSLGAGLTPQSSPGDGPASPSARLFLSEREGLVAIAPDGGARRTVLAGHFKSSTEVQP